MAERGRTPIRVLVVDDEAGVRDAYRQILLGLDVSPDISAFRELRARTFRRSGADSTGIRLAAGTGTFDTVFCGHAEEAVALVQQALAQDRGFAVVFLDVHTPPDHGTWAASRIREIDPAVEIVICTSSAEVDPFAMGGLVPPEDKLSYLHKPFHPHEVRQMTIALGIKWRAERQIVRLAYFDPLTELPNREHFRNRLASALETAEREQERFALLYLDLDDFKSINDTLGHAAGDELLRTVGNRLRSALCRADGLDPPGGAGGRPGDLARLGGDEFIALLPHLRSIAEAGAAAERLMDALRQPVRLAAHSVIVTASVGIAIYPQDAPDAATLLHHADRAMYFAKRTRRGKCAFFHPATSATAVPPRHGWVPHAAQSDDRRSSGTAHRAR